MRSGKALERELAVREKAMFSAGEFAAAVGVAERTATKAIRAACLRPVQANGALRYHLRDLIAACFLCDDSGRINPDRLNSYQQKAFHEGQLARLKLARLAGKLIDVEDHVAELARAAKILDRGLSIAPDRMEQAGLLSGDGLTKFEELIDALRAEIADELVGAMRATTKDEGTK
jgi:hypothetical protein